MSTSDASATLAILSGEPPSTCLSLWVTDADYDPASLPDVVWVDVTAVVPQPDAGWTFDGQNWTQPTAQANQATLLAKAAAALSTNQTYLALATPTTAQAVAQVAALTRQVDVLIRLAAQLLTSTAGT